METLSGTTPEVTESGGGGGVKGVTGSHSATRPRKCKITLYTLTPYALNARDAYILHSS